MKSFAMILAVLTTAALVGCGGAETPAATEAKPAASATEAPAASAPAAAAAPAPSASAAKK